MSPNRAAFELVKIENSIKSPSFKIIWSKFHFFCVIWEAKILNLFFLTRFLLPKSLKNKFHIFNTLLFFFHFWFLYNCLFIQNSNCCSSLSVFNYLNICIFDKQIKSDLMRISFGKGINMWPMLKSMCFTKLIS